MSQTTFKLAGAVPGHATSRSPATLQAGLSRMRHSGTGNRILMTLLSLLVGVLAFKQQANANPSAIIGGTGAFQDFNVNVEGYNPGNAYLGAYLTTLMYPENLVALYEPYAPVAGDARATARDKAVKDQRRKALATALHYDFSQFLGKYEQATRHLFGGQQVQFQGVNTCVRNQLETYDYEAVLISTPGAVLVVVRGTDRVDCSASGPEYTFSEWIGTDFIFWQEPPMVRDARTRRDVAIGGAGALVHRGFWQSTMLANANTSTANIVSKIRQMSGSGAKKIWILGHSLGSAHAQTLAILLTANQLRPQGVYVYAAPHVGNPALVQWMNQNIGKNRIQRFDFKIDPITILPTYRLVDPANQLRRQDWWRAGVRNYFSDVHTLERATSERIGAEDLNPMLSLPQGLARGGENALVTAVKLDAVWPITPGIVPFCYHHPQWIVQATFNQLPRTVRGRMPKPAPLGVPQATREWLACNKMTVDWGMQKNLLDDALAVASSGTAVVAAGAAAGAQAIQNISFNVGQLFANLSGTAVAEGLYYIRAHQYPDRYLADLASCAGTNGCPLVLSNKKTPFWIRRSGPAYIMERQNGTKWQRVDLAAQQLAVQGGKVQLWDRGLLAPNPNQTWMFFRASANGPFLFRNNAGIVNKVIDARNCTASSTNCVVTSFEGISNSQHQLWVFENAN